jgi:hypothetical protein
VRILAAHDAEGNIHHLVVSPADAPLATVTSETGLLVTEVEAPEVVSGLDLSGPGSRKELDRVLEYLRDFRVEVGKGKLQRK